MKIPSMKFEENLSICSRFVPHGQKNGRTDITWLVVAVCFAIARKKKYRIMG